MPRWRANLNPQTANAGPTVPPFTCSRRIIDGAWRVADPKGDAIGLWDCGATASPGVLLHPMNLTRRGVTPADMEGLFDISKRALREHVENTFGPWGESEQRAMFFKSTDPSTHEIWSDGGIPIGFTWVARSDREIYLHRISIVPEHQNKGMGTRLIRELMQESATTGRPLKLQVFPGNPARRLYERLGFREVDRTETHIHMAWDSDKSRHT